MIRSMANSRFDPDIRKWILNVKAYDAIMIELKKICTAN